MEAWRADLLSPRDIVELLLAQSVGRHHIACWFYKDVTGFVPGATIFLTWLCQLLRYKSRPCTVRSNTVLIQGPGPLLGAFTLRHGPYCRHIQLHRQLWTLIRATHFTHKPNIFLRICAHTHTITISIDLCPPMSTHAQ